MKILSLEFKEICFLNFVLIFLPAISAARFNHIYPYIHFFDLSLST